MPLSDNEHQILAQLELSFREDSGHLARIERRARGRRTLVGIAAPIGLLVGLVLVVVGVGLDAWLGDVLAVAAYALLVSSGYFGVIRPRGVRRGRRAGGFARGRVL